MLARVATNLTKPRNDRCWVSSLSQFERANGGLHAPSLSPGGEDVSEPFYSKADVWNTVKAQSAFLRPHFLIGREK